MPRKTYRHDIYRKISHAERISIIYDHLIHRVPLKHIRDQADVNYNSVRHIIHSYKKTGRTNKKNFASQILKSQQMRRRKSKGTHVVKLDDLSRGDDPTQSGAHSAVVRMSGTKLLVDLSKICELNSIPENQQERCPLILTRKQGRSDASQNSRELGSMLNAADTYCLVKHP